MPHVVDLNSLVPGIAAMPPETQLKSLQEALAPSMLRTDRNALQRTQLPPAELWVPCALPPVQRDCIKTLLARFYDVLTDAKLPRYSGHKAGQFRTICGELRKICSHPLMVPDVFDQDDVVNGLPDYLAASGKLQLLDRLLRMLQHQGKRVAVASQSPKVCSRLCLYVCQTVFVIQMSVNQASMWDARQSTCTRIACVCVCGRVHTISRSTAYKCTHTKPLNR